MRMHDGVCGFCLSTMWMPFRCLESWQECLLEDSKDPPKTAAAVDMPTGGPPLEAYLTPQSASRRL